MKKIFAIIAAALTVAACEFPEAIFRAQNVGDYCTYKEGKLVNDYGTVLNVTEDATDGKWQAEGNRMYTVYDVQNAQMDITLKSYLLGTIKANDGKVDSENPDAPTGDPVMIADCNISGTYLNVVFTYYYKEGTDCPHHTRLLYRDDGETLTMYMVHDGNGETPVELEESSLQTKKVLYCFEILDMVPSGEYRTIVFDADMLGKSEDGKYVSKHVSSYLYGQKVQF